MYQPTILIADDEPFIVRSLSFVLKKQGYHVETANDGQEALDVAKECQPHILFLDIMMPRKSGYEVCETLKSDPGSHNVHVIMLTAKGQESDKEIAMKAGADEYMTKPFSPRHVVERVSEIAQSR